MRAWIGVVLVLAACGNNPSVLDGVAPSAHRLVVISIDGLMPDVYQHPDDHGLRVPFLRHMVADGTSARVRGVMPTVTYPSHTTLVTGVPPQVHGIVSNEPLDPLYKNQEGWRWYAEDIQVPTLWDAVEHAGRHAALVQWPVTVGAHATIVVPEYWRAGGVEDQKLLRALSTPGVLEPAGGVEWQYWTPPTTRDYGPFLTATRIWVHQHPDLMLVHGYELDDAQHDHGPWSPEAVAVIEHADELIASLAMNLGPDTTLVVVSDHGFAPTENEVRLGALFVKAGLIELDDQGKPKRARVAVSAHGGTAFIYLLDQTAGADVDTALATLGPTIARRIDRKDITAMGGDPDAAFAVVAEKGVQLSDSIVGEIRVMVPHHGAHGWPPDDPAMQSSFLAIGPSIGHRDLGTIDMTQIAPMLAGYLGVTLR